MAKYYGTVGFLSTHESETSPGDWVEEIVEKKYYGEVLENKRSWQSANQLNDDITIRNRISILADEYAYRNLHEIRYVTWLGTKWRVTDIDISYPRLNLSIGGVFNGPEGPQASTT